MCADSHGAKHDGSRACLAALSGDTAPVAAIAEAAPRSGGWPPERRWVRTYGRFDPEREPFVTMVFELDAEPQLIAHVEVFTTRPAASTDRASTVVEHAEGWFRVTPFPADDALPTLSAVLDHPGRRRV